MQQIVNGKLCIFPDSATVGDIQRSLGPQAAQDEALVDTGSGTRPANPKEKPTPGSKLWFIPAIVKGAGAARLDAEVALLRKAAGGRSQVRLGGKTVGGRRYTGVLVKNVRMDNKKFGVTTSDLLFLLPPEYPRLPPIGCYLNYRWPTADHHFTLQSHYGAPFLGEDGWYWYCTGLGGGFDKSKWSQHWKPGSTPDNGHNLATLFISARHAINHD